ncbi:oxidoreductase [Hypericibacter terrae]|uniref:Oxidoreductase n=1 Tax=Hypericibacter terrae TaxID=2602015 RepID=A0A5J6MNQ8_9PROT|nr:SDR family oxidoreductase [Hypericibacter terrae]QEX18817.1 oxidoreductase [Hypericibacter terrae]
MGQLDHRVAIVTGASTGIGLAIAKAFAAEGAKVVLAARSRDKLQAAADAIRANGGEALAITTDISKENQVGILFSRTVEAYGKVDILVNNAGVAAPETVENLSLEDWQRVMDVNVTGAFLCSREAFRLMKPQGGGRIINIGSVSAKAPRHKSAAYTTSKFALEGLTRSLGLDGRSYGIAVSVLQPGNTDTPIWLGAEEKARKEGWMAAEDVARVAVLIASLPPDVNLYESVILPVTMPFLGRG